ncbi:PQQ-binding-like beta-propeller repeat protein [uncultured Jatrophihabitans sp.]|uniref:outer membrane protein assembly factor BamB family protein n=1 Tax=uncultured Jatrophihabitans sp. TaxID=1610747 RepID=UPI0035CB8E03
MTASRVDAPAEESDAALARYRVGLRKQRLVYFSVVGAIVVALVVTVSIAWSRGEAANTTLRTVTAPPANLAIASPAAAAQVAWRTSDSAAIGNPRSGGTVVVYSRHTVRGVDARTGKQTWSYTRSNRTVCAAAQAQGTTVAVYEVGGNCDELTGLDSGTGRRRWTRTLDEDGRPLNGHPQIQVMNDLVMFTTAGVIYTIQTGGTQPYDKWVYTRFGCSIQRAVLGSLNVLISQTCTDPGCGTLKFCGRGPQLLLRSNDPADDKSKNPTNYDKIIWNLIGNTDVPVSVDNRVSALNTTTSELDLFSSTSGQPNGSTTLSPAPAASGAITVTSAGDDLLVTVRGVAAALGGDPNRPTWARSVTAPLTAVPTADSADLTIDDARITVPTSTGAAVLDGVSGQVVHAVTLTPLPPAGSSIYPLGAGELATGPAGTVAYR